MRVLRGNLRQLLTRDCLGFGFWGGLGFPAERSEDAKRQE